MSRVCAIFLGVLVSVLLQGCDIGGEKKAGREKGIPLFEDNFGHAVGAAGDVNKDGFADVIVGAWGNDGAGDDAGAAYIFFGGPEGVKGRSANEANVTLKGEAAINYFGIAVGGDCDLNADGYSDVFVGASLSDKGGQDTGTVYIYYGGAQGPSPTPSHTISGISDGDQFGLAVACGGDLNKDRIDDLVVGAPLEDLDIPGDLSGPDTGAVYIFFGSQQGIKLTSAKEADRAIRGIAAGDWFGNALARVGDVNQDGVDDALVAAYWNEPGSPKRFRNAGAAYVFYGIPGEGIKQDRATEPDGHLKGAARWDNFGTSVAGAGDVNGDGVADVIIGADENDQPGRINGGGAYIYYGSKQGLSTLVDAYLYGDNGGDYLGTAVAGGGDINKDGFSDVAIGARESAAGVEKAGAVYIFYGGKDGIAGGPAGEARTILTGISEEGHFGFSLANLGDFNGDGYADLIVGAPSHDRAGGAFIFYGSKDGVKSGTATDADLILLATAK